MMPALTDLPERMQRKVKAHAISECWTWTGSRNAKGYGSVANGRGGSMLAHRASYELLVGPIEGDLTIDQPNGSIRYWVAPEPAPIPAHLDFDLKPEDVTVEWLLAQFREMGERMRQMRRN